MKFGHIYVAEQVPEWVSEYMDYKTVKQQVKIIKEKIVNMVKEASEKSTDPSKKTHLAINVAELPEEIDFWKMLDTNIARVEKFYAFQAEEFSSQFQNLTIAAVLLGLITEYVPQHHNNWGTRLQREIARVAGNVEVDITGITTEPEPKSSDKTETQVEKNLGELRARSKSIKATLTQSSLNLRKSTNQVASPAVKHLARVQTKVGATNKGMKDSDDKTLFKSKHNRALSLELSDLDIAPVVTTTDSVPFDKAIVENDHLSKEELEDCFRELYRGLFLLQKYCQLNATAIQKLLKKHDKNVGSTTQEAFLTSKLSHKAFVKAHDLKVLFTEVEYVFANAFSGGFRTKAMDRLRVPGTEASPGATWRFGWNVGVSLALLGVIIYYINTSVVDFAQSQEIYTVYRFLGMALLLTWAWGFDMLVWTLHKVNYIFIFEFDPRKHQRYQNLGETAGIMTVLLLIVLLFNLACSTGAPGFANAVGKFPPAIFPLVMLVLQFIVFVYAQIRTKFWLVKTIIRIVCAPFYFVKFKDFILADQITSIAIVLFDLEFTFCFFAYDAWTGTHYCLAANSWVKPCIAFLPGLWRLLQSFRRYRDQRDKVHLLNAGKYLTGLCVVSLSFVRVYHKETAPLVIWILTISASTIYTYSWDVFWDWGLGNRKFGFLRERLLYPKWVYYFAIVANLALRLMWTFTISPSSVGIVGSEKEFLFATVLAGIEICRRAMWNLLRIENEQLNNIGKFRAVDIHVPLMH